MLNVRNTWPRDVSQTGTPTIYTPSNKKLVVMGEISPFYTLADGMRHRAKWSVLHINNYFSLEKLPELSEKRDANCLLTMVGRSACLNNKCPKLCPKWF